MKIQMGSDAFLMALQSNQAKRCYINPSTRTILVWDGVTVAVFRQGFLLGEHKTDYVTTPTNDEFKQAMERISRDYPLPQTAKER